MTNNIATIYEYATLDSGQALDVQEYTLKTNEKQRSNNQQRNNEIKYGNSFTNQRSPKIFTSRKRLRNKGKKTRRNSTHAKNV